MIAENGMKYRNIGKTGIQISEIAIGSWMTRLDDQNRVSTAQQIIREAYSAGINFFDCADGYNNGKSEEFLGEALRNYQRSTYVISSKVFFPVGSGVNERGLSRKHIMESIDTSLSKLGVDYVDLYFCHRFDPNTPMEETLQAMSDLVEKGKVLYYGVSEWSAAQIERALGIIKDYNLRPLTVIQPQYNMMDRYIEDEIMEIAKREGIGITVFSPLSQGLLTGKYKLDGKIPDGSRATYQTDQQINRFLTRENLEKVSELSSIAESLEITMAQLALAWILRKQEISCVITGASNKQQLDSNLKASGVVLDEKVLQEIDRILDYHPFYRKIG